MTYLKVVSGKDSEELVKKVNEVLKVTEGNVLSIHINHGQDSDWYEAFIECYSNGKEEKTHD